MGQRWVTTGEPGETQPPYGMVARWGPGLPLEKTRFGWRTHGALSAEANQMNYAWWTSNICGDCQGSLEVGNSEFSFSPLICITRIQKSNASTWSGPYGRNMLCRENKNKYWVQIVGICLRERSGKRKYSQWLLNISDDFSAQSLPTGPQCLILSVFIHFLQIYFRGWTKQLFIKLKQDHPRINDSTGSINHLRSIDLLSF